MTRCDTDPNILKWGSESFGVPYYSKVDRKMRRYFIDFVMTVRTRDGGTQKYMVEVKPNKERFPPKPGRRKTAKSKRTYARAVLTYQRNQDKWDAATVFAEKHDMKFIIMDEFSLGIKKRK